MALTQGTTTNAYSIFEATLKDILDGIKPLRKDWVTRFKIVEELEDVVKSVESLRGATVEPFGSFVSNLFSRWGDLDISIMLSNDSYISFATRKRKQNLLEDLQEALRQKGGWLRFIPDARVPILKFKTGRQGISCDVSIDNILGLMKSKFLLWINEIDRRFRDMVLLVKEWATAHEIKDPKAGTFNSYSLSLLVIFHFQTCVPAILPPLKDIYPRNVVDDFTGVRTDAERRVGEICAANISRYRSDKFRAVNRSSLPELFISFLAKFSDISSKSAELGICPFTGQWEEIRRKTRWLPRTYALFIEDPFEQPDNTARTVTARNLVKISEAFQTTYHLLVLPNQNRISLLSSLVRPQISRFIAGMLVGNSSNSTGHHPTTRPPMSKPVYLPSRSQYRTSNPRQEDHSNDLSMRRKGRHPSNSTSQRRVPHYNSPGQPDMEGLDGSNRIFLQFDH